MDAVPAGTATACPDCGAETYAGAKYCWLCGRSLAGSPFAVGTAPAAPRANAVWQFGLSTLLLFVTLAAVVLGVWRISHGLGIGLAVLIAPPLVRTCVAAAKAEGRGRPLSGADKRRSFARSLGVTLAVSASVVVLAAAVVGALAIALLAACLASIGS